MSGSKTGTGPKKKTNKKPVAKKTKK